MFDGVEVLEGVEVFEGAALAELSGWGAVAAEPEGAGELVAVESGEISVLGAAWPAIGEPITRPVSAAWPRLQLPARTPRLITPTTFFVKVLTRRTPQSEC